MNNYRDTTDPTTEESENLLQENAKIRDANIQLAQQMAQLELDLAKTKKMKTATSLWKKLTAEDFWKTQEAGLSEAPEGGLPPLTGIQLFTRLFGSQVDSQT